MDFNNKLEKQLALTIKENKMKTETIYICPICNNGTLKDTGESIDSGECSACG